MRRGRGRASKGGHRALVRGEVRERGGAERLRLGRVSYLDVSVLVDVLRYRFRAGCNGHPECCVAHVHSITQSDRTAHPAPVITVCPPFQLLHSLSVRVAALRPDDGVREHGRGAVPKAARHACRHATRKLLARVRHRERASVGEGWVGRGFAGVVGVQLGRRCVRDDVGRLVEGVFARRVLVCEHRGLRCVPVFLRDPQGHASKVGSRRRKTGTQQGVCVWQASLWPCWDRRTRASVRDR